MSYCTGLLDDNLYIEAGPERTFPNQLLTDVTIWAGNRNNILFAVNSSVGQGCHFAVHC